MLELFFPTPNTLRLSESTKARRLRKVVRSDVFYRITCGFLSRSSGGRGITFFYDALRVVVVVETWSEQRTGRADGGEENAPFLIPCVFA